jgi:hypothetical protein
MYDNLPSYFGRKYGIFCGSLPDIIAVMAGIKPLTRLSFFAKGESYSRFIKFVEKHGLLAQESQYRQNADFEGKKKISLKNNNRDILRHIYLSKSMKTLDFYRFADPDLCLGENNRPPKNILAPLQKFSNDLGYPDCCTKIYLKNGQRKKIYSYSRSARGNRAPFYMNNFLHSISNYYLSFHSPCSFTCKKTKAYNKKIFDAIRELEPEFAARMRQVLTMPMIIWFNKSDFPFDDRIVVLFDGFYKDGAISYSKCFILRTSYPNNKSFSKEIGQDLIFLKDGDKIKNAEHEIYVYKRKKLIHIVKRRHAFDGLLFRFYA